MFKFLITGLVAFSFQAQASSQFERYQELCELQADEEEVTDAKLEVISQLDIDDVKELSAEILGMVNYHLLERSYAEKDLSLAQIKELFLTGEEKFNDLYIITMKSKVSGRVYIQVQSFPGDNPYGNIFLAISAQLVAVNEDGGISIVGDQRFISCPWN